MPHTTLITDYEIDHLFYEISECAKTNCYLRFMYQHYPEWYFQPHQFYYCYDHRYLADQSLIHPEYTVWYEWNERNTNEHPIKRFI